MNQTTMMKRMTSDEYREKLLRSVDATVRRVISRHLRTHLTALCARRDVDPGPVAILLRTMVRKKLNPDDIFEISK